MWPGWKEEDQLETADLDQDGRHIFEVESFKLIDRPAMGCKTKKSGGEMPLQETIKDRYRYRKVKVFDLSD